MESLRLHPLSIKAQAGFLARYGCVPEVVVHAPGRINLIGEHTDYNGGYVLPAAIPQGVCVAMARHPGLHHKWYAMDTDEDAEVPLATRFAAGKGWVDYFLGAFHLAMSEGQQGFAIQCVFTSDLPAGAGLSSSSALTCGFLLGLNALFRLDKTREELAMLAHHVEHDFIGLRGGIMDQHACLLCQPEHFILLDCLDRSYRHVAFTPPTDMTIFLIDTRVQHKLTESDYNTRAAECQRALELLHDAMGIQNLREITSGDVHVYSAVLGPILARRIGFVVEENARVLAAVRAIESHNWPKLGEYLFSSHVGLRDSYEVSCVELDFLVATIAQEAEILGARMMGGGFGGCTINLATFSPGPELIDKISAQYKRRFGLDCAFINVNLAEGARFELISE